MFKYLIAALLLPLSLSAQVDIWTPVAKEKLALVKKSVADAFEAKSFQCTGVIVENGQSTTRDVSFFEVSGMLAESNKGAWIKKDSSQPLLMFQDDTLDADKRFETSILVSTTPDKKQVTSVSLEQSISTKTNVNIGTLDNPVYQEVMQIVRTAVINCK